MQKLITSHLIDQKGAVYITDALWSLMESGIEEVKILQSVLLLLTINTVVHGETLARVCIFSRNLITEIFSYIFIGSCFVLPITFCKKFNNY